MDVGTWFAGAQVKSSVLMHEGRNKLAEIMIGQSTRYYEIGL